MQAKNGEPRSTCEMSGTLISAASMRSICVSTGTGTSLCSLSSFIFPLISTASFSYFRRYAAVLSSQGMRLFSIASFLPCPTAHQANSLSVIRNYYKQNEFSDCTDCFPRDRSFKLYAPVITRHLALFFRGIFALHITVTRRSNNSQ